MLEAHFYGITFEASSQVDFARGRSYLNYVLFSGRFFARSKNFLDLCSAISVSSRDGGEC